MEEKYWEQFMASGQINDYLCYKGFSICSQVMEKYADKASESQSISLESKGKCSESDNSYRNGDLIGSYR